MASARRSAVENKFVTVRRTLSAEEQRDIKSLFVRTGKIGGFVRSSNRSGVWEYYGELCYKDVSGSTLSVDADRHYCSLCLIKQQCGNIGHLSKVQSYTLSTGTTTLNDHLRCEHDIKLTKVSQFFGPQF